MALQCVNDSVSTGLPFNFTGAVYADGHIEGTQVFSDGETFKVQLSYMLPGKECGDVIQ